MPRPLRITTPNIPFHVLNRGNNKQIVFQEEEDYFIWCGLYNELNPVRARLVEKPKDWQWSSFNFYASGETDSLIGELIEIDPYYINSGNSPSERQERYRQNIENIMKEKFLIDIRDKLDEGIFGKPEFIIEMKKRFKIKSLRPRGRPKKEKK